MSFRWHSIFYSIIICRVQLMTKIDLCFNSCYHCNHEAVFRVIWYCQYFHNKQLPLLVCHNLPKMYMLEQRKGWGYLCSHLCCLHTAIHISSLCGFWHCHPYIPIHFGKCFWYFWITVPVFVYWHTQFISYIRAAHCFIDLLYQI